jgi:hypothetical protein
MQEILYSITSIIFGVAVAIFLFFPAVVGYWYLSMIHPITNERMRLSWTHAIVPVLMILLVLFFK